VESNNLASDPIWERWTHLLEEAWISSKNEMNENKLPMDEMNSLCKEQLDVLEILQKHCPSLYEGKCGFRLSFKKSSKLIEVIRASANSESHFEKRMKFFLAGINIGHDTGLWIIDSKLLTLCRDRFNSIVVSESMPRRLCMAILKKGFLDSLGSIDRQTKEQRAAQLIFSASVFGGIFSMKKMEAWITALTDGFRASEDYAWACLQSDNHSKKGFIPQMWFADPLTEALYYKWHDTYGSGLVDSGLFRDDKVSKSQIWKLLFVYLQEISPEGYHLPKRYNEFFKWAESGVLLELHPFLVSFASSLHPSTSLPSNAWLRLRKDCCLASASNKDLPLSVKLENIRVLYKKKAKKVRQKNQKTFKSLTLSFIKTCKENKLKGTDLKEAVSVFRKDMTAEKNEKHMYLITEMLAEWAIFLVCKTENSLTTINDYMSKTARLYDVAGRLDMHSLKEGGLIEVYEKFIKKLNVKDPGQYCERLVYFHKFIIHQYSALEIVFSEIEGFCSSNNRVDANIISVKEFTHIKNIFSREIQKFNKTKSNYNWRESFIQYLVVVLGFRCGLRASEALKLRVKDICMSDVMPEMFIRHHASRKLKTANAVRKIPLKVCLEEDELSALKSWLQMRHVEVQERKNSPLFTAKKSSKKPIWGPGVFRAINLVMREVTGDQTVHFHHFRHSFANWMLIKMMASDFPELRDSKIVQEQGITVDKQFTLALSGNEYAGSKMLYVLSRLMGHSSPDVTIARYVHLLDFILAQGLQRVSPELEYNAALKIFGISFSTLYRRDDHNHGKIKASMLIKDLRRQKILSAKLGEKLEDPLASYACNLRRVYCPPVAGTVESMSKTNQIELSMWKFMKMHNDKGMTWNQISHYYGVNIADLEAWWKSAIEFANIRTRSQKLCKERFFRGAGHRANQVRTIRPATGGYPARHHLIPTLSGGGDTEEAARLLCQMKKLPKRYSNLVFSCTRDFMNRVSPLGSELIFNQARKAKRYIKFLNLIGIAQKRIIALHYSARDVETDQKNTHRNWWARQLDLPSSSVIKRDKSATRETGKYGWVSIIVQDCDSKNKMSAMPDILKIRRISDHSFKYAIHTYAVLLSTRLPMRSSA